MRVRYLFVILVAIALGLASLAASSRGAGEAEIARKGLVHAPWTADEDEADDESGDEGDDEGEDDEDVVVEFAQSEIFFEFNATDLDLGLHIFFDAMGWKDVEVTGPDGNVFEVENGGGLNQIGSTEVFTESAEPPLDEDHLEEEIAEFQARFPAGEYEFKGETIEGYTLSSSAMLKHGLPAAPGLVFPDPDAEENLADPDSTVIEWMDTSGPDDPEIERYEVVVEFEEEETGRVFVVVIQVPADPDAATQSVMVPVDWFESLDGLEGEFKAEVVAIEGTRNATISEAEFELD